MKPQTKRDAPKFKRSGLMLSSSTRRFGPTPRRIPSPDGSVSEQPREPQERYERPERSAGAESIKRRARDYVRKLKQEHPVCCDCKHEWPPYVLEFDHVDPKTKKFNVGDASSVPSMEALVEEAEKCDLLCSNCHKIREHNRKKSAGT